MVKSGQEENSLGRFPGSENNWIHNLGFLWGKQVYFITIFHETLDTWSILDGCANVTKSLVNKDPHVLTWRYSAFPATSCHTPETENYTTIV